ncbi:gas vesicle protein [Kribbella sp. NPDC023855]|uniref:gas vesicle protein GvpO n=1 Tax=Kribbella sp. NPDC023855 TaxID=3154698 RepID=UPI0033F73055
MPTPRKSAERSTPAKRSPAKKTSARASSNGQSESAGTSRPRASAPRKSLRAIAVGAAAELSELIGQIPEGIVGVEKTDDGWRVQLEVVESRRIPETTDIMAIYEVDVDPDGAVTGYRRLQRYVRGRTEE